MRFNLTKHTRALIILLAVLLAASFSQIASAGTAVSVDIKTKEAGTLEVHFLDVGQGDAALILQDEHAMLIDGGGIQSSRLLYSYLSLLSVTSLDYVIATHAHEDHVGGIAGALQFAEAGTIFSVYDHVEDVAFVNFKEAAVNKGGFLTSPEIGQSYPFGDAEFSVVGPRRNFQNLNDNSIVIRLTFGEHTFLFTGDAEREAEQALLNAGVNLAGTVLKVGHHGSHSSTTYPFLREVMPAYAVISCGADNPYGYPAEDTLSRLRDAGVEVFRTDLQGHIIFTSDGFNLDIQTEKNRDLAAFYGAASTVAGVTCGTASEETVSGIEYVLNINTKKIHYPYCASVNQMKESNKMLTTESRDTLIGEGYSPCGNCKP